MSIYFVLYIMLGAGILGGIINYYLSLSDSNNTGFWKSLIIGIGATTLIPLFLEIAQSKLLDNIRESKSLTVAVTDAKANSEQTSKDKKADSLASAKKGNNASSNNTTSPIEKPPLKDYFLFAAYCLLAAAAGPRFINSLMDGVLKDKKISELAKENTKVTEEKNKIQQVQELQTARNVVLAKTDEENAIASIPSGEAIAAIIKPKIGPKTVANDPQKGRFGGKQADHERKLCAKVTPIAGQLLFKVKIWVESTNNAKPLSGDVIFYLHDTFRPSVITLPEDQFTDGKAMLETKIAWGAFTVGAVVDGGLTLLEYDLAEDSSFPTAFRER